MTKKLILEQAQVAAVLRKDILIATDTASDGRQKRFAFNPWEEEYIVYHGDAEVDGGQILKNLLDVYNAL